MERLNNKCKLLNEQFDGYINEVYKTGQATIIALILKCKHGTDKYKMEDLIVYVEEFMKNDEVLKDYVYEYMKKY